MNRKNNSICLSAILAVATATSFQATANSYDAAQAITRGGGQAPPSPSGGSTFAVRVASNLDKGEADSLKQDLIKEGFTAAESRPAPGGQHEVVIAGIPARGQAERIVEDLKGSGYTTSVEIVGSGAASPAASPGTGQSIYRVKVAEFDSAAEATEASKVLIEERFVNVDIVEDSGKHVLMLGTFNREQDAQALLGDVNGAGFALASVVKREKLNTGSSSADADLSSLPAAQQADTRDVLAMAEKVESGEATADEVKQLRQRIEQLTENQKAIVAQQETNRSAEQNKIQKTYPIYREFDQAVRARNFDRAEQLLTQVKQINPNDIFLPGKERMLAEQRSSGNAAAPQPSSGASVDPAQVQQALNEARVAEAGGDKTRALEKYRAVVALDPTNVEARGKISELETAPRAAAAEADAPKDNKMLIYGGAALAALILLLFGWMKMRGNKSAASEPAPTATPSYSFDTVDPLASTATPTPTGSPNLGASTAIGASGGLSTADMSAMPGMHSFGLDDEEPEVPVAKQTPAPQPVAQESDSVSFEDMMGETPAPAAPTPEAAPADEVVSINFDDEIAPAAPAVSAATPTPAAGSSAMDADLEALLKGTFAGTEEPVSVNPGDDIVSASAGNVAGAAASAESQPEPTVVYSQDFASADTGSAPENWRGEYDYASLTVADLGEAAHSKALMFDKSEGAGSATYHLGFPKASGKVVAEFDLRCDQKNKFLLGVYFEKDEDFKQSIHTIVHQLDPNAPATLRVQGEAAPYEMGTWSHIRFEVDLNNGTIDAYMDDNHVVRGNALTVVPDYINTLSIRDNLATTGTLYLDNIRVSEA